MDTHKFMQMCEDKLQKVVPLGAKIWLVWVTKAAQNNKAVYADSITPFLYEVTHNGDTGEVYFVTYQQVKKETLKVTEGGLV